MLPIAKPVIGKKELAIVSNVLKSGMLAGGKYMEEFEQKFSQYIGTKYAIATSCGTTALHLAVMSLGIREGDEVITTPFTFTASADAISFCGANPVFVDIEKGSFNIDVSKIEEKITKKTKAILVVHLYGLPVNMERILSIAKKHKLYVIEDSAQSHGAEINHKKTGSFGDLGCFSFYATKNMTTGEGGMVTTNSKKLANRIKMLRNHGSRVKYKHEILGYNYMMTNIEAAIGLVQLASLDNFNLKRIKNAKFLSNKLKDNKYIDIPTVPENVKHVFHQYTIRTKRRRALIKALSNNNIGYGIHYPIPLHLQPNNKRLGYKKGDFPESETASKEVLSLPIHPSVTKKDLDLIANISNSTFNK